MANNSLDLALATLITGINVPETGQEGYAVRVANTLSPGQFFQYTSTADLPSLVGASENDSLYVDNLGALQFGVNPAFAALLASAFASMQLRTFTGAGTYTPTAGTLAVVALLQGAGGGGGGAVTVDTANDGAAGAGGGGGGCSIQILTAAQLGAGTVSYSVATGGAAGDATGSNGTAAAASTLSGAGFSTLTANGGSGGAGEAGNTITEIALGGNGGTATGGLINITGTGGRNGNVFQTPNGAFLMSGAGGGCLLSGGAAGYEREQNNVASGVREIAGVAGPKGSGGSGGHVTNSTTGVTGGAGGDGLLVVLELGT